MSQVGQELKKQADAGRDLQKELKQVDKLLKLDPSGTVAVTQKQALLADQIANTRDKLRALESMQESVNAQFKAGEINEKQYRTFQREIEETRIKLSGLEKTLKDLSNPLKELGENLQKTGSKMVSLGKELSLKVTAPIMAFGALSVKTAAEYNSAMSDIQAKTGYTAEDMERLGAGVRSVSKDIGVNVVDLAKNTSMLVDSTVDVGLVIEQMTHGVNLAVGAQTEFATVFDFTSSAMKTFKLGADKTQEVMDSFALASTKGNASLADLAGSYSNAAGAANNAGLSIHDVNAILITMAEAGSSGTKAGTELNSILTELSTPSAKAAKELARLKISLYDSSGAGRDTFQIMRELERALSGMSDKQRATTESIIFGSVAQKGWTRLMSEGIDEISALSAELATASDMYDGIGAAAGMAQIQQGDFAGQSAKFKAALAEVALVVAEKITPALTKLTGIATKLANKFSEMSPATVTVVVALAAVAAAIGPLLVAVGALVNSVGTLLVALPKIAAAFTAVSLPMLAVVGIAAAVAAAGYLIYQNWDKIKEFFLDLWEKIKDIFSSAKDKITEGLKNWGPTLLAVLTGPIGLIGLAIYKNWDEIKDRTINAWNGIKDSISGRVNAIKDLIVNAFNAIVDFISKLSFFELGKNLIQGLINGVKGKTADLQKAGADAGMALFRAAQNALEISSPSKKGVELGENFADSVGVGVTKNTTKAAKAAEAMSKKVYANAKLWIENYKNDVDYLAAEELRMWEDLTAKYTSVSKERVEIDKNIARLRLVVAKESFDHSKEWIDREKKFKRLSLTEEVEAWERVQARYLEGTEQRKKADESLFEAQQRLQAERENIQKKITAAEENLRKAEEARYVAIMNTFGLFEQLKEKEAVIGQDLTKNLQDQVTEIRKWAESLEALAKRGVDEGLVEELRKMGPKANSEIMAMVKMSDTELDRYNKIWQEKSELARKIVVSETQDLRKQTNLEVAGLAKDLDQKAGNEFKKAGINTIQGFVKGFRSGMLDLRDAVQEAADYARRTLDDALERRSPSKVFARAGRDVITGLVQGIRGGIPDLGRVMREVSAGMTMDDTRAQIFGAARPAGGNTHNVQNTDNRIINITVQDGEDLLRMLQRMGVRL